MTPEQIAAAAAGVVGDIEARGHHLRLEFGGASTAYHSDERATSTWIQQFFEGYFVPSDGREGDVAVYSTADPALLASLQALASRSAPVGDGDRVEIPFTDSVALFRKRAGKVSPREDVYHLLFKERRRIVLVTSGNLAVRREEGMQTLRAATKWLLLERGWIPLHSACVAKDGRAICVTGSKGSGKTSTMLNLLLRNGCELVAVDKFLLRDGGSHLEVRGLPGKIGIRVGSAAVLPPLLDWLARTADSFFPHITLEEVQHIAATSTPEQLRSHGEKIHLLPSELATLFGTSITPDAPLELLLVPVFDLDVEQARLVRADPEQSIEMLMTCYVGLLSKGEDFLLHFFDLSDTLIRQRLAVLLGRHLPGVAAYEVHQNHRTNERTAELVAGLLHEGAVPDTDGAQPACRCP